MIEFHDLEPWLQATALALYERWRLDEEFRLIWQTQLTEDQETGMLPGFEGLAFTQVHRSLTVRDAESNATFALLTGRSGSMLGTIWTANMPAGRNAPLATMKTWVVVPPFLEPLLNELEQLNLIARDGQSFSVTSKGEAVFSGAAMSTGLAPGTERHQGWLAEQTRRVPMVLGALQEQLSVTVVQDIAHEILQGDLSPATGVALRVARERDIVISMATQMRLLAEAEQGDLDDTVVQIAEHLLTEGVERQRAIELLERFATAAEPKFDFPDEMLDAEQAAVFQHLVDTPTGIDGIEEAVRVLLEHVPRRCLPVIRRALRDEMDTLTAVRLIAIGTHWAIDEVVSAIPDKRNPLFQQSMLSLLEVAGHHDRARQLRNSMPPNPLDASLEMLDVDIGGLQQLVSSQHPAALEALEEWAARIRSSWPDGFDPTID